MQSRYSVGVSVSGANKQPLSVRGNVMAITISSQTPWLMLFRMSGEARLCREPQRHPVNARHHAGQPDLTALAQDERTRLATEIAAESTANSC
jgi:aldose 1-epimerase